METKFNSQICTTREQSERLLALGLKKETADMCRYKDSDGYWTTGLVEEIEQDVIEYYDIPAWSLHRLIEMIPLEVTITGYVFPYRIPLAEAVLANISDTYDGLIDAFDRLIKEGYFNKDYLEE